MEISIDTTNINIRFINIYTYYVMIKISDLYVKTDHLFEPEL